MELRQYQINTVADARTLLAQLKPGERRIIIQASTGAGKTVIASEIIRGCTEKGKRTLFVAPARELVKQCSDKLDRFGVPHGIIMAGCPYDLDQKVQVCTKDSLRSRTKTINARLDKARSALQEAEEAWQGIVDAQKHRDHIERLENLKIEMPAAELVIFDECHLSLAATYQEIMEYYSASVIIGLTATPARSDGRGLKDVYNGMVCAISSSELIRQGFLVPTRCYAPFRPDLKGVKWNSKTGEYDPNELGRRMDKPQLVGDIVEQWKRLGEDRLTICFASGISHSVHIRDQFIAAGISAAHVDGETPTEERDDILARFAAGDIKVLTNCNVLTAGWDCPAVSCCILAKPTRSYVMFRQTAGRIQRPWEGKTDAILIDHSGCVYEFGFPDADVDWQLKATEKVQDQVKERNKKLLNKPIHCPQCHAMFTNSAVCPACGYRLSAKHLPKHVKIENGQLVEVQKELDVVIGKEDMVRHWHHCLAIAANKGRAAKAALGMFSQKYKIAPWEAGGLPNLPNANQWQTPVAVLFPQYIRRKRS